MVLMALKRQRRKSRKPIFVAAFTLLWQEGHVEMVMLQSAGHNVHVDDLPGNMHFVFREGKGSYMYWKTLHGTHA